MIEVVDKILSDLRVFSKVGVGDKIYLRGNRLCVLEPGLINSAWRFARQDTREKSIGILTNLFNESLVLLEFLNSKNDQEHLYNRLFQELQKCIISLKNLSDTYRGDVVITSQLDVIRERLSDRLLGSSSPDTSDQMNYQRYVILAIES